MIRPLYMLGNGLSLHPQRAPSKRSNQTPKITAGSLEATNPRLMDQWSTLPACRFYVITYRLKQSLQKMMNIFQNHLKMLEFDTCQRNHGSNYNTWHFQQIYQHSSQIYNDIPWNIFSNDHDNDHP